MLTAFQQLVGRSAVMQRLRDQILQLASYDIPIHIQGESGVGKELVARALHEEGARAKAPLVAINCAATPDSLVESEYFGHCQGSFSGATVTRKGLLLAAQGGTVFLDEVADLGLTAQAKLLRVLQERRIKAVGADNEQVLDVRFISASHRDLHFSQPQRGFRADLYHRLAVVTLQVPSLRARLEDLPQLVPLVLSRLAERWGLPQVVPDPAIYQYLKTYHYPGNVRELENLLAQVLVECHSPCLSVNDLQKHPIWCTNSSYFKQKYVKMETHSDLKQQLVRLERTLIQAALNRCHGKQAIAAKELGISARALKYRIQKLGIVNYV